MDAKRKLLPPEGYQPIEELEEPTIEEAEISSNTEEEYKQLIRRAQIAKAKLDEANRSKTVKERADKLSNVQEELYTLVYDTYSFVYDNQAKLDAIKKNTDEIVAYINEGKQPQKRSGILGFIWR